MPYVWGRKNDLVCLCHASYDACTGRDVMEPLYYEQGTTWTSEATKRAVKHLHEIVRAYERERNTHAFRANQVAADVMARRYWSHIDELNNGAEIKEIV